jgi:hypothetical protein
MNDYTLYQNLPIGTRCYILNGYYKITKQYNQSEYRNYKIKLLKGTGNVSYVAHQSFVDCKNYRLESLQLHFFFEKGE